MKYIVEFVVSGNRDFPVDMLRYDRCWPATSESATMLGRGEIRDVQLKCYAENKVPPITEGRWQSFGWRVISTKMTKI